MTADLPDNLRSLDDDLMNALSIFAPPKDLDAKILKHIAHRTRLSLVPSPLMVKTAAAVVAIGLLAGVGYVADRQMGGESPLATASEEMRRFGFADKIPGWYAETKVDDAEAHVRNWAELSATGDQKEREDLRTRNESAARRGERGQDLLYSDGHVEWKKEEAFEGTKSDNIYSQHNQPGQSTGVSGDARDSVLLPTDGAAPNLPKPVIVPEDELKSARSSKVLKDTYDFAKAPDFSLTDSTRTNGSGGGGGAGLFGDQASVEHFKPRIATNQSARERTVVDIELKSQSTDGKEARSLESGKKTLAGDIDGNGLADGPAPAEPSVTRLGEMTNNGGFRVVDATGQPAPNAQQQLPAVVVRQKVIRNGVVEFEVDSFDTALMTITKLVVEQGGFVASTDSAKLPNGKTRGAVTLRVPPERLDTFVLMLRGIGDLKSQKISAQDVSKQYTDIESQLKAARAMEERLLEMIQKGNGAIKDLLAAEKELGIWREKIEKFEGEKRYYDNLISLSTLTLTLQERDIKASAATVETETVSAGVETDDVEKARAEIIKSIDEAKGRVISSDLKKLDAGQFAATIVAEVEPDRSGPVVDRLQQLGKVARLDVDRKQTTVDGTGTPVPGAHVERKPTTLTISLYNLANVAPRLTTSATVASDNVEDNYRQIMAIVEKAGGRVVTSQLQRPQPDQVQATLQIEVPSAQAAATQAALQSLGETMNLQLSENPDTANVTTAKQGFSLRLISAASVPARETTTLQLAAKDVSEAHRTLQAAADAGGARVVQSNVTEGDRDNVSAVLQLELPRAKLADWDKAQQAAGEVLTRSVVRSSDTQNTLDSKVRLSIAIYPVDKLPPRQTTSASLHVGSAESSQQTFLTQASQLGGRVIDQSVSRDANGRSNARVVFDVPRDQATQIISDLRSAGEIWAMNTSTNPQAPDGSLSRTRFDLQFSEGEALVGPDDGVWSSIKAGLATSLQGLGWSVRLLVIGLCLVAPWVIVLWGVWKLMRRKKTKQTSLAV